MSPGICTNNKQRHSSDALTWECDLWEILVYIFKMVGSWVIVCWCCWSLRFPQTAGVETLKHLENERTSSCQPTVRFLPLVFHLIYKSLCNGPKDGWRLSCLEQITPRSNNLRQEMLVTYVYNYPIKIIPFSD